MYKTIAKVDGMRCGMCESHVNDVVRRNFDVKKVSFARQGRSGDCKRTACRRAKVALCRRRTRLRCRHGDKRGVQAKRLVRLAEKVTLANVYAVNVF